MNLVLLEPADFTDQDHVRIADRRCRHILEVHRCSPGDELRVGLVNGRIGTARIVTIGAAALTMEVSLFQEPPEPMPATIILALPRPKVMRRILFGLAVLGVKNIVLVNAARVEKSYWQTPFLQEESVRRQLLLGLEQAGDTVVPRVLFKPLFRPFVEDELPLLCGHSLGLVAHPAAPEPCPRGVRGPVTLAVGPEGGFVPFEIEALRASGLKPVSIGRRILNTEVAIPALLATIF